MTSEREAAALELIAALRAMVFQARQGKVLERDACVTQAAEALVKARAAWRLTTTRDLRLKDHYWDIAVPAGAAVVEVSEATAEGERRINGYALAEPTKYGISAHDAEYRWAWVPTDAVIT